MIFAGVFAVVAGAGMIVQWVMSAAAHKIPEIKTEPIRIGFHIAAEVLTALTLIAGGIGLLMGQGWGRDIVLVALGMLFYTVIVSPGYFAQKGQWAWLGMFGTILILGIICLFLVI